MLGVKFQKNENIMFLVCNKGIFSREERLLVDSPFNIDTYLRIRKQIRLTQKYGDPQPWCKQLALEWKWLFIILLLI